jgi:hypothetical protein
MPLLPQGEAIYSSLQGRPGICEQSLTDLRTKVLGQQEANWGTVQPNSLEVHTPPPPNRSNTCRRTGTHVCALDTAGGLLGKFTNHGAVHQQYEHLF